MKKILAGLEQGRTIGQYDTHSRDNYRWQWDFRWNDTLEVVNAKSIYALRRKGGEIDITISDKIVKY